MKILIYKLISVVIAIACAEPLLTFTHQAQANGQWSRLRLKEKYDPIAASFNYVGFKEFGVLKAREGYRLAQTKFSDVC